MANHMLNGVLEDIMSPEAAPLRQNFIFRIVPMLNPDGVVWGNYRCSQLGCDLNRKWDRANRLLHPEIFYTFQMMKMIRSQLKMQLYCDFHGHNRHLGAFFYGCTYLNCEHEGRPNNALLRIVPYMCCSKSKFYDLKGCAFHMHSSKEGTGRHVVFSKLNVMLSFTLEASFFGYRKKIKKGNKITSEIIHFTINDYESCGKTLVETLYHYLPGRQRGLMYLVGKVMKAFKVENHLRDAEKEKILQVQADNENRG